MPEFENYSHNITVGEIISGPPNWLTTTYLEDALKAHKRDNDLKIVDMRFSPVTGKGENFASSMARVRVRYISGPDNQDVSETFIVKTPFEGDQFVCDRLEEFGIYKCELNFYDCILPQMTTKLQNSGYYRPVGPNTVKIDFKKDLIIFEDLTPLGYTMPDKRKGLDLAHIKMVLERLAAMHAASAVLEQLQPGTFRCYDRGMYNHYTEGLCNYFRNNLELCADLISTWPGYERYSKKMLKLAPKLLEYGRHLFDAKDRYFNVLTHGDIWINNLLFQYDESSGRPVDVMLIDFQYACWSSATLDLHYIFNSSLEEDLRLNHQDELLKYYYDHFVQFLRKMNFQQYIPTLHEFRVEFVEHEFYAFQTACLVQPVMMGEDPTDASFECLMGHDERSVNFRKRLYNNKKVQRNLKALLPLFDRRGLLDIA